MLNEIRNKYIVNKDKIKTNEQIVNNNFIFRLPPFVFVYVAGCEEF